MEPDTTTPNMNRRTAHAGPAGPSVEYHAQSPTDRSIIRPFPAAISALKQHTFTNVADFPSAARVAAELHIRTRQIVDAADISNLQAARDSLHPVDHYLAYISTLHATLAAVERDSPLLASLLADFRKLVRQTDAHCARAVPERWIGTARHAVRLALNDPATTRALSLVNVLREASDKLCTQADEIVPLHADYLAVCLHAKCYRVAAQWIHQQRRLHVDVTSGLEGTDVHLVYYYSALVLIGRKEFRAALQKCRLALAVPAPSPGLFINAAVQTYKTYILLHLLVVGTPPQTLKLTSYQSGAFRKTLSEYEELAHSYGMRDMAQVQQLIESNRGLFQAQGNLGIVKQLVESLFQKLVCRLSNSYVTITLQDMANKVGVASGENAHNMLVQMVDAKRVNARIDERTNVVRLMDDEVLDEEELARKISSSSMTQCLDIMTRIQRFREVMDSDPEYIRRDMSHQQSRKSATSAPFSGGATAMPMGGTEIEAEFMR